MPAELEPPLRSDSTTEQPTAEQTATERATETEPTTTVFPYTGSVDDSCLPFVRARGVFRSNAGTDRHGEPSTCPDCGEETINGAGLFACTDCSWTGSFR